MGQYVFIVFDGDGDPAVFAHEIDAECFAAGYGDGRQVHERSVCVGEVAAAMIAHARDED